MCREVILKGLKVGVRVELCKSVEERRLLHYHLFLLRQSERLEEKSKIKSLERSGNLGCAHRIVELGVIPVLYACP